MRSHPKHWLAIYTTSRSEKKVHQRLLEEGFESYCPLNLVNRKWSDRVKVVEEPLFKSYVFVHLTEPEHTLVRHVPGVINFVYYLGKPAIIRDYEIDDIRRFLDEYQDVKVKKLAEPIAPGNRIRITSGLLMDREATAIKIRRNKVEILIESIGFKLIATIDKSKLKKI